MTNQELLSGFLDRSLNEDELLEFEARQNTSPEFASEVREMLTVEDLLTQSAPRLNYPVGFLSAVESSIALKVAAGVAATGVFAGIAHSVWGWIAGGTAAVAIGGGALYMANSHSEPATNLAAPAAVSALPSRPPIAPEPTPSLPPTTSPMVEPKKTTSVETPRTPNAESVLLKANADNSPSVTKQLTADYEKCKGSNDHIRCSQLALSIGRQLRKDGEGTEARQYLEAAIQHARAMKLIDFEIDANGELGLLEVSEGNEQRAALAFTRAIEQGHQSQKNVDRWRVELEKLTKK